MSRAIKETAPVRSHPDTEAPAVNCRLTRQPANPSSNAAKTTWSTRELSGRRKFTHPS